MSRRSILFKRTRIMNHNRKSKRYDETHKVKDKSLFKQFLTKTSLRALPRASKSVTKQGKAFWFSVFLLLSSSFLVCIGTAIGAYLEYKTKFNQQMEENLYPFPSVTVCPHRPFSNKGENIMISKTHRSPFLFIQQYEAWKKNYSKRKNLSSEDSVPLEYPTMKHFIQLFSTHNISQLTPHPQEVIFSCRVNKGTDSGAINLDLWEECNFEEYLTRWILYDDRFVLCYIFNFQKTYRDTANGLKLTLFLENYLSMELNDTQKSPSSLQQCHQCMPKTGETWRQGVVVTIHEPNTKPQIKRVGIDLSPGSVNDIIFDAKITHYDKTFTKCVDPNRVKNYTESNGQCFHYSLDLCEQKKLQDYIRKECRCVESSLPITIKEYSSHPNYCEMWDFDKMKKDQMYEMEVIKSTECLNRAKLNINHNNGNDVCFVKCNDILYSTTLSSTIGFHKTILDYLYDQILKKYNNKTYIYSPELFRQAVERKNSILAARELLESKDFHDSFIVVNIKRKNFTPIVRRETIAYPIQTLLSLIGGFASLFMGFTAFVFFEVGELITKLLSRQIHRYIYKESKEIENVAPQD